MLAPLCDIPSPFHAKRPVKGLDTFIYRVPATSYFPPEGVSSPQKSLTAGFGMRPGVTSPTNHRNTGHDKHEKDIMRKNRKVCNVYIRQHFPDKSFLQHTCAIIIPRLAYQETRQRISTPRLNASLRFHLVPINLIISEEFQTIPHLEVGFPLRCFQRLSIPNIATRPCSWRNNRYTRG